MDGQPHRVVPGAQVAHIVAGRPGVDQVRFTGGVAGDRVGDHGVISTDVELLDVLPAGVGDPRVDVDPASPAFRTTHDLQDAVAGRDVSGFIGGELGGIVHQGIQGGDPVRFGERLVGDQPLHACPGHFEAQGGHVLGDQRTVGHLTGQELVVVGEPRVDPEVELAVGHRHEGVGRRQLQVGGVRHAITQLAQQGSDNRSLHVTGRPVGPRHRHRHTVARKRHIFGHFRGLVGLVHGVIGLVHGVVRLVHGVIGLLCRGGGGGGRGSRGLLDRLFGVVSAGRRQQRQHRENGDQCPDMSSLRHIVLLCYSFLGCCLRVKGSLSGCLLCGIRSFLRLGSSALDRPRRPWTGGTLSRHPARR